MTVLEPNHYATLGLDRNCTAAQIRAAFRVLARKHHPDLNHGSAEATGRIQQINAAYDVLSDPEGRAAYDRSRPLAKETNRYASSARREINVSQEVHLRIEELIRGTSLEVRVNDPANPEGSEMYQLMIPPETAPGTRFRLARSVPFKGGFVVIRVRAKAGFKFKVRGSDLRCDLRIHARRAAQGGEEPVIGATGARLRLVIPARVGRGEILRIPGEGLPTRRGGRGDLLVRIIYRPEVRISRVSRRGVREA